MSLWLLLFIFFILCLVAFLFYERAPPAPSGVFCPLPWIPWLGNLIETQKNAYRIYDWLSDIYARHPQQTFYWSLPHHWFAYVISTPESVKHVLRDNFENYEKGETIRHLSEEVLGQGIFAVDGKKWKHQRKLGSHMFTLRFLRDYMTSVFATGCETIVQKFDNYSQAQKEFDLQDIFFRFTLEHFVEIAFGVHLGCLEQDVPFARAFDNCQNTVFLRVINPWWKLCRILSIGSEKNFKRDVKIVNEFVGSIITRRRKETDAENKPDLVSKFLAYSKETGEEMSDEYLRDIVLNFIIAGRDTTAQTLSWTIWNLSQNPDVLQKLRREVDRNLRPDQIPDYQVVSEMNYTHAVISENLRLYPVVPGIFKTSIKEDKLPDGTKIPPNAAVLYSAYALGRQEYIWGEDAKQFKPERWLESDDDKNDPPIYTLKPAPPDWKFPAFNVGARLCLGKPVAYLESKMLLTLLVRRYDIKITPGQKITYRNSLTLPMANGLMVTLQRRKD